MKKILLSTIAITMMLSATAQPTTKTVKLKVVETSDVHGHFFPYDFMEKKPIKGTLSRANTYINKEREKYGKDHFLLIDNGDILQGQPCVYWSNYVMPENENLAASVINYMQYDAETVGNHDIEPGHKVYDKWIREVRCPLLGANIVKEGSDGTANPKNIYTGLQPYSIHYSQSQEHLHRPAALLHPLHRRREDCHHRYAHACHPQLADRKRMERHGI